MCLLLTLVFGLMFCTSGVFYVPTAYPGCTGLFDVPTEQPVYPVVYSIVVTFQCYYY